jgi:hypothetical protein
MTAKSLLMLAAAAAIATARPHAQGARTPAAEAQQDRGSFSAVTTAVLVDVVVRGRDGKPVTDLRAGDFELRGTMSFRKSARSPASRAAAASASTSAFAIPTRRRS